MKKRTVITTEKREVWVIRDGSLTTESPDQPAVDVSSDENQSLTTTDHEHPDKKAEE